MAKPEPSNKNSEAKKHALLVLVFMAVLSVMAFLFYSNSIDNFFSYKDYFVAYDNPATLKGLGGVIEIFSTPQEYGSEFPVYRPLGRLSYALEYQFSIASPNLPQISHFVNVLLYLFGVLMLFQVLRRLFRKYSPWFPFLVSVLFLAHPVHGEVVNSLYYRDILLAFLFSFFAVNQFLNWIDRSKMRHLVFGSVSFFLALLSNESALVFVILFPLIIFFFTDASRQKIVQLFATETTVAVLALVIPLTYLPFEANPVLYYENPLVTETGLQVSSSFYVLAWYFKMLVYPNPMSFFYGYDILPVQSWGNPVVWISMFFLVGIIVFALTYIKKKSILSFLILFFIISILPYTNLFWPVRGIVGERFLYFPSVAFSILLVWILFKLFNIFKENTQVKYWKTTVVVLLVALMAVPAQLITRERNKVWQTGITLYRNDVKTYPQSAFINNLLGRERLKPVVVEMAKEVSPYKFIISDIKEVENYSKAAVAIDSTLSESWERLGYVDAEIHGWMAVRRMESYSNQKKEAQSEMEEANAAEYIAKANRYYDNALKYNCNDSAFIYFRKASAYRIIYQFDNSLENFEQAIRLAPGNLQYRNEYVQTLLRAGKYVEALLANDDLMKNFPESDIPYLNLAGYQYFAGDTISAVKNYEIAIQKGTRKPEVGKLLYYYYKNKGDFNRANYYMEVSYEAEKAAGKK